MIREAFPRSGFVYVLTNPAMPGLVKIGRTNRSVDARAEELWSTGVPAPFEVYCEVKFPDCHRAESTTHHEYEGLRVSKFREFFSVRPERVTQFLENELYRQIEEIVHEFSHGQDDLKTTPELVSNTGDHRLRRRDSKYTINEFDIWVASQKARVPEQLIWHFFCYFPWEDARARDWIIDQYLEIRKTSQYRGGNPYWFKGEDGEYQRRPGPEDTVQ